MLLLSANLSPILFFVSVFQGTYQSFLISTFCTNFVFLHAKPFEFLHCLGLIDTLCAYQNAETFVCILLGDEQLSQFDRTEALI